jgi:hypothetical protein
MSEYFKLQLLVVDDLDESHWIDFYLDVSKITGWYVPPDNTDTPNGDKSINIYIGGDVFGIKQEDHIKYYLRNNCFPNGKE